MSINYKFNIGQLVRIATFGEEYDGRIGRVTLRPILHPLSAVAWYNIKCQDGQEVLRKENELKRYVD